MTYVLINPVTDRMTDPEELEKALCAHRLQRVTCRENWTRRVLEEYSAVLQTEKKTVLDTRCPMAVELVRALQIDRIREAPVLPILLHCAKELSDREDLQEGEIVVTTPCRALAEQGNSFNLPRTEFITSREFLDVIGYHSVKQLDCSPIPPGFFDPLGVVTVTATGGQEITERAASLPLKTRLFEALFCPGGCHNGDGV